MKSNNRECNEAGEDWIYWIWLLIFAFLPLKLNLNLFPLAGGLNSVSIFIYCGKERKQKIKPNSEIQRPWKKETGFDLAFVVWFDSSIHCAKTFCWKSNPKANQIIRFQFFQFKTSGNNTAITCFSPRMICIIHTVIISSNFISLLLLLAGWLQDWIEVWAASGFGGGMQRKQTSNPIWKQPSQDESSLLFFI